MPTYSTTTKYLLRALLGGNLVSDIDTGFASLASDIDSNMAGYAEGTFAGKPAAAKAGRIYRCTDTGQWLADTGSAWVEIARLATALGAYETVSETSILIAGGATAATYYATESGSSGVSGVDSAGITPAVLPITLADYAVSGLATWFRVQALTATNSVAPAVNFTYELCPVTSAGSAGSVAITLGTPVGSPTTVTRTAPAANSTFVDATSDFTIGSNGAYALAVALSGTAAANSRTTVRLRLQIHRI
jgi:hypothetical protein